MLLVLISLFTATILTTAYLASRDNSSTIGENVAASASARWAAASTIELGVAIMETDTDWRTLHVNGKLLDDYVFGDGTVDLDLTDMETGQPPTADTDHLLMEATAMVDGVAQASEAVAVVFPDEGGTIDLDLSEFAVFSKGTLEMKDSSTLTKWPMAPASKGGDRIAVGTLSTGAGSIDLMGDSAAIDTTVYHPPGASSSLVFVAGGPEVELYELGDTVPVLDPPTHGEDPPSGDTGWRVDLYGNSYTLDFDVRVDYVDLDYSRFTIEGDVTLVVDHDFNVAYSKVTIDGNVKIVVFDDLWITGAAVELAEDATLEIYVKDSIGMDDGYLGADRPDGELDTSGNADYEDVQRLTLYGDSGGNNNYIELSHDSVVKAVFYTPNKDMIIKDDAAFYGCLAVNDLTIQNQASLFYDHALNSSYGYTNPDSVVYDGNGHVHSAIANLNSFDRTALGDFAELMDFYIVFAGEAFGEPPANDPELIVLGDPTPRTVEVEFDLKSFGSDVEDWETKFETEFNEGFEFVNGSKSAEDVALK